ncbi:hypothetical protein AB4097_17080, partial [Microvirga sp. 2MCAF35]|uniref:hypothetical protein n=1 Tax=Microvirga sp. 2MCAF35 TaxID=3232987 RepID=UPI003F98175C
TERPCAVSTSTCRNFATISSAVCLFLGILSSSKWQKAIHQGGPLQRGQASGAVAAIMGQGHPLLRLGRGFVGALVSLNLTPAVSPFAEATFEHVSGWLLTTPLDLDIQSVSGATGFLLGVCGMVLAQACVDTVKSIGRQIPALIVKWLGGPAKPAP